MDLTILVDVLYVREDETVGGFIGLAGSYAAARARAMHQQAESRGQVLATYCRLCISGVLTGFLFLEPLL